MPEHPANLILEPVVSPVLHKHIRTALSLKSFTWGAPRKALVLGAFGAAPPNQRTLQ